MSDFQTFGNLIAQQILFNGLMKSVFVVAAIAAALFWVKKYVK